MLDCVLKTDTTIQFHTLICIFSYCHESYLLLRFHCNSAVFPFVTTCEDGLKYPLKMHSNA